MTALVLGVGNPDRGDDGIGPAVARLCRQQRPELRVVSPVEPSRLIEHWSGADSVVVVDAVRTGRPAGSVLVHDATDEPLPVCGSVGTHGVDLATVVELARTLGVLPARLVLVLVEAASTGIGESLSPAARAAVLPAAEAVRRAVAGEAVAPGADPGTFGPAVHRRARVRSESGGGD